MGKNQDNFYFKCYHKEIRGDSDYKLLPYHLKGILFDLLLYMPDSDEPGTLVSHGEVLSDAKIAQLIGGDKDAVVALLSDLLAARIIARRKDGAIYHPLTHRKARKAALCRDAGRKGGGNPTFKGPDKGEFEGQSKGSSNSNSRSSSSSEKGVQGEKVHQTTIPPPVDAVITHGASIGLPAEECRAFHDYFTSNGWRVGGKTPMRNWQAALNTWKRNMGNFHQVNGKRKPKPIDINAPGKAFATERANTERLNELAAKEAEARMKLNGGKP